MKRRAFLKNSAFISAATYYPQFVKGMIELSGVKRKRLIVVQLSGGNDGLNTLVPYRSDEYYKLRPNLALSKSEISSISNEAAFNKNLSFFVDSYKNGELAIINQVGYPNPNKSHFRSMDIWQSASDSRQYVNTGWLGRYLDHKCSGCETSNSHLAIESNNNLSLVLQGKENFGLAVNKKWHFKKMLEKGWIGQMASYNKSEYKEVDYLYKVLAQTVESGEYISKKLSTKSSSKNFGSSKIGSQLKMIAEIIEAGAETEIFYASQSGYDTHINQNKKQASLFSDLNLSIASLVKSLKQIKEWDNTVIMVFSEFGRRVNQNHNKGTDHGEANNVYLLGGSLRKPGMYNKLSNLSNLENDNLQFEIDFRRIYSEILENHFQADSSKILNRKFNKLGIL